jgi:hypothetical protein
MKKYIYKALALLAFTGILASCYQEQDVEPVVPASTKAVITIERVDGLSSVSEGDTLEFVITSSKMLESSIDFSAILAETAVAEEEVDYAVIGGVLSPYSTSTTMQVVVLDDGFPEMSEKLAFEIDAASVGQNWQLNPESEVETVDVDVANINQEGVITIALTWPNHDDDLDMYIFSVEEDDDWGGFDAATGANPEINTNLWPSDPNGTYYVGIDPFHLEEASTPYTFHIGMEDGSVQIIEGVFDTSKIDSYAVDNGAYRLLQIDIVDGAVTITHVAP